MNPLDKLGAIVRKYAEDVFFFGGLGLIAWGLWEIYPPLSAIVTGVLLILFSMLVLVNKLS